MIAWVAGHTHVNKVTPYPDGKGRGFWSIRAAAEADWPQQTRLLEVFDNRDGTLSIFGTILDHAGEAAAPPPGTSAAAMTLPTSPPSAAPSPTTIPRSAGGSANPTPAARARSTTATSS